MKGTVALFVIATAAASVAANGCPPAQESDWSIEVLLEHQRCDMFYKCTYGQPVEQFCPAGLHFNIDTWECDWISNVNCAGRIDPTEPELPSQPEPEPESNDPEPEVIEPEPEIIEPEPEVIVPEPEFIEPEPEVIEPEPEVVEPEPEVIEPEPELVEPEPEVIEPEPEVIEPEPEVIEPEPEVIEPKPEVNEPEPEVVDPEPGFLENGCPIDPHVYWLLPHEYNCNQFYYCVWGGKQLRDCSSTLHFNRVKQVCDWPQDAGCTPSFNKHPQERRVLLQSLY